MTFTQSLTYQWGETIRERRRAQGHSLEALADIAQINAGHLSKAERGLAGLGDEARIRLASALRCRVEDIFSYPDTSKGGSSRTKRSA